MSIFHGLSAFPLTPCDAQGHVDTANLGQLVTRLTQAGVGSIGLLGSTGTYAYLTRAERLRAVKAAVEAKDSTPLIVGVGTMRTDDAVALATDAQSAGADALLMAPVSYTPLTQDEAFAHFRTVAAATDLPLCIYNNPSTTHFTFGRPLLEQLAAEPNIASVKMPIPADSDVAAELAALRPRMPEDFKIGYSADWTCADALLAGADTWYSASAGILPAIMQDLAQTALSGDIVGVAARNATLAPLWKLVEAHGSLRVVYAIAQHLGLTKSNAPRPILPLDPDATKQVCTVVDALGVSEHPSRHV